MLGISALIAQRKPKAFPHVEILALCVCVCVCDAVPTHKTRVGSFFLFKAHDDAQHSDVRSAFSQPWTQR